MRWIEQARELTIRNLPLVVFGLFYFLTSVLVNILYAVGIGRDWPARFIPDFSWSNFDAAFGGAFWILVLCPFLALPLVAIPVARALRPVAWWSSDRIIRDIGAIPHAALALALYSYAAWKLFVVGAPFLLAAGEGEMGPVEQRFALQAALGFPGRVVILSLLTFMAVYALIKAVRGRGKFWLCAAAIQLVSMFVILGLLGMKWPVVLFVITLGAAVFVTARRFAILKAAGIALLGVFVYAVMFLVVQHEIPIRTGAVQQPHVVLASYAPPGPREPSRIAEALENAGIVALNRMGMAVPYYYDTFSENGQFCGSFFDWALHTPDLKCRPSLYIYSQMFHDAFEGRGTAPAVFQIYEYAREGWPGVIVSLTIAGVLLGAFMALRGPAKESDMIATIFVMGVPVAYLLTQLPIEGVIIYDNGIAWWGALVLINSAAVWLWRKGSGA